MTFLFTRLGLFITKRCSLMSFLYLCSGVFNRRLQFRGVFSLGGDNKYFQVCEFLSEFHKHLASL